MRGLADALDNVLLQGQNLLEGLEQVDYAAADPIGNGASIGAHYRHCLDHFIQLFAGVEKGLVDYDARIRESVLENDRDAALKATGRLLIAGRQLRKIGAEVPLEIKCGVSYGSEEAGCASSTLGREMMFCISHSIHHYALIAMLLRARRRNVPEGFGVAPSTIRHRQRIADTR